MISVFNCLVEYTLNVSEYFKWPFARIPGFVATYNNCVDQPAHSRKLIQCKFVIRADKLDIQTLKRLASDVCTESNIVQWHSQNAERVTHIKGRKPYQAMIIYNYAPFQRGNFSERKVFATRRREFFPLRVHCSSLR